MARKKEKAEKKGWYGWWGQWGWQDDNRRQRIHIVGAGAVAVIYILSVWGSKSFWKYHGLEASVTNRKGSAIFPLISHNHTVRWGKVTQCLRTGVQEDIFVFLHKKSSVRLGVVRVCNTSHFIFPMSHTCSFFCHKHSHESTRTKHGNICQIGLSFRRLFSFMFFSSS